MPERFVGPMLSAAELDEVRVRVGRLVHHTGSHDPIGNVGYGPYYGRLCERCIFDRLFNHMAALDRTISNQNLYMQQRDGELESLKGDLAELMVAAQDVVDHFNLPSGNVGWLASLQRLRALLARLRR